MSLHCFFIPARGPEPAQTEPNNCMGSRRVLAVQREWLHDGAHSGWAFCVEVVAGPGPLPAELKVSSARRGAEVDYKQTLSAEDFAVYAQLREWRKQCAQADGVPLYAVFSNEQLAAAVTQRVDSLAALGRLEGVGASRQGKYGPALLAQLLSAQAHQGGVA